MITLWRQPIHSWVAISILKRFISYWKAWDIRERDNASTKTYVDCGKNLVPTRTRNCLDCLYINNHELVILLFFIISTYFEIKTVALYSSSSFYLASSLQTENILSLLPSRQQHPINEKCSHMAGGMSRQFGTDGKSCVSFQTKWTTNIWQFNAWRHQPWYLRSIVILNACTCISSSYDIHYKNIN